MKQEELILKLKMLGDVSDIKKNLDSVQSWLGKVGKNLDVKQTSKLLEKTRELSAAYKKYVDLINQPNKTTANLRQIENLSSKITKNYQELGDELKQIDFSQFDVEIDPKVLNELNAAIKKANDALKDFNNEQIANLKKAFSDNSSASLGKKGNILYDIKAAVDKGDVEELSRQFERLNKNKDKFSGSNKTLATSLLDILKNMVGPLELANEESKKAREASEKAKLALEQENEAVKQNVIARNEKATAEAFDVTQLENLFNETQQVVSAETRAAQAADQFKQRLLYLVSAANGVQIIRRAFQQTYKAVKELDDVMTEMAVVTDLSVGDYWKQLPQYTERAYALGAAIKDVYASMTLYYQQGLNTQQATALSNATMKMARIAGLQAADATDRMTAAMRGFNMALNETNADNVADVYSALAATSAADVDEISTAMTKVASIAHSANMEFETTSALLTAIIETTRESAETAGTALKTVIARFSEVKSLYSTGELTSNDEEGEEIDVNKISKALRVAGINLNEYLTGAKGLDDIFLELSKKWDTLDNVTQRYIATMAAGSRQQSRFIAMMQNYSRNMELVETAENAAGAATEQFNKTLESLDAKMNQLRTQWQSFTTTIFDQQAIKIGVTGATKFLEVINKITGSSWVAKVTAGGLAFNLVRGAVTKAIPVISNYASKMAGLGKAQETINRLSNLKNAGLLVGDQVQELQKATNYLNSQVTLKTRLLQLTQLDGQSLRLINNLDSQGVDLLNNKQQCQAAINVLGLQENQLEEAQWILQQNQYKEETRLLAIRELQNTDKTKELALSTAMGAVEKETTLSSIGRWVVEKFINVEKAKGLKLQTASLIGLGSILIALGIIAGIIALINNNSLNGISKKIEKHTEEWEQVKSELESVNNELDDTKQKLKELEERGKIEFVSEGEINELKQQIRDLEAERERLIEEEQKKAAEAQADRERWLIKYEQEQGTEIVHGEEINGLLDWSSLNKNQVLEVYDNVIKGATQGFLEANKNIVDQWAKSAYQSGAFSFDVAAQYVDLSFDKDSLNRELVELYNKYKDEVQSDDLQNTIIQHLSKTNKAVIQTLLDDDEDLIEKIQNLIQNKDVNLDKANVYTLAAANKALTDFQKQAEATNEAYKEINEGNGLTAKTFGELRDSLSDAERTSWEFNNLMEQMAHGSIEDQQRALDALVSSTSEFKNVLMQVMPVNDDMAESEREVALAHNQNIIKQLELMGFDNAAILVNQAQSLSEEEKAQAILGVSSALAVEAMRQQIRNAGAEAMIGWNDAQVTSFLNLAKAIGYTGEAALQLSKIMTALRNGDYSINALAGALGTSVEGARDAYNWWGRQQASEGKDSSIEAYLTKLYDEHISRIQNRINDLHYVPTPGSYSGWGGGSSGGGGGSSQADQWENDYDRLYNLLERIENEQRVLNHLQEVYNDKLREAGTHDELVENLKEQEASLLRQQKYYKELRRYREQELANAMQTYSGIADLIRVVKVGDQNVVHIDWENIDAIDNSELYDAVEAAEDEYNRIIESLNEANDKLDTVDDDLIKLRESWRKDIIDFKNRIKEALIKRAQDQIDALENTNKAIDDANKALIDNINTQISEARTQREREQQEQDLADQRRRLAYLMQDTTGANQLEILKLQKEIAEGEQDYTDQLIDDKINELEKQNDEAAAAREKQIEIMQDQLDWFSANGGFWEQVGNLIGNGDDLLPDKEALFELFKNFDNFKGMSEEEQEQFEEELLHDIENVSAELGAYGDEIPNPDVETAINEGGNSYLDNGGNEGAGNTNPNLTSDGYPKLSGDDLKWVVGAVWQGWWGANEQRRAWLTEAFGAQQAAQIQDLVNQGWRNEYYDTPWRYSHNQFASWYKRYKTGGLADFTGPAWLDGSKAHPELVLSAKDSENFIQLRDVLSHMYANGTGTTQTFGDAYYTFQIQVDQLSSDYDVDQMIDRIQKRIEDSSRYRNVNAVNLMR